MSVSLAAIPAASEAAILAEKLTQKELDYSELQSLFTKYKLKQKVKYDKLREEVLNYVKKSGGDSDKENAALLMVRVSETESKLEEAERRADALNRELQRRQTQINDQIILIRNMEEQLRTRHPLSEAERTERKRMNEMLDMDSIHAQMTYKDERIIELNNVILDKERQILDLQELVKEQGEVASSKKQAMRLVQKRFEEMESISRRSVGTETDSSLIGAASNGRGRAELLESNTRSVRGSSPGRAIKGHSHHGTSSPPPLDPSEDSYLDDDDIPGSSSSGFKGKRNLDEEKRRKKRRVTFDLPPSGSVECVALLPDAFASSEANTSTSVTENQAEDADEIAKAIEELTRENEQLRNEREERRREMVLLQERVAGTDSDMARLTRYNKSAVAKARVVAQARIKDLEDTMAELNRTYSAQTEQMQSQIETLRSTREWEIEENARLREQFVKIKEKNIKLHAEVDAAVAANREMEERMGAEHEVMQRMMDDLEDAEGILVEQEEEKSELLDDLEKLRGAIFAQEQFIEILEADIVIYEEHIGILRESLGASKVDHRDLIRSKAFEAKLKALEEEKQEIARTRHDERLRTKALNAKVRMLEGENEKLMARICEMEMRRDAGEEGEEQTTGRQKETLELQLAEADRRLSSMREEFDQQLASARQETDRSSRQAQILRDSVERLQSELNTARTLSSDDRSWMEPKQTILPDECDRLQLENAEIDHEIDALREKLSELQEALHEAEEIKETLGEQITQVGAENFELHQRVEELERGNDELNELRAAVERFEQILAAEQADDRIHRERDVYQRQAAQLDADLEVVKGRLLEREVELRAAREDSLSLQRRADFAETQLLMLQGLQAEMSSVVEVEDLQQIASSRTDSSSLCIERLEEENKRLKGELDLARLSLAETREVQKEVELLKAELEEERCKGEAKWSEVCQKMLQAAAESGGEEGSVGRASRKASLEEMHSYLDAYAEKCKRLEDELRETRGKLENFSASVSPSVSPDLESALLETRDRLRDLERELEQRVTEGERNVEKIRSMEEELSRAQEKIETDKTEKKKLKAAVKQLRDKTHHQHNPTRECVEAKPVEEPVVASSAVLLQSSSTATQPASWVSSVATTPPEELNELRQRLERSEMEARLSGELNVELGRAMQDMEDRIDQLVVCKEDRDRRIDQLNCELNRAAGEAVEKERRLTRDIDLLVEQQNELSFRAEIAEESFNNDELHSKLRSLEEEIAELKADLSLERSLREERAEETESVREAERVQARMREEEQAAHHDEIRKLAIENEDLRRTLSDKDEEISSLTEMVACAEQQAAAWQHVQSTVEIVGAVEEELRPQGHQHASLLRASAATTDAVTTLLEETSEEFSQVQPATANEQYYEYASTPSSSSVLQPYHCQSATNSSDHSCDGRYHQAAPVLPFYSATPADYSIGAQPLSVASQSISFQSTQAPTAPSASNEFHQSVADHSYGSRPYSSPEHSYAAQYTPSGYDGVAQSASDHSYYSTQTNSSARSEQAEYRTAPSQPAIRAPPDLGRAHLNQQHEPDGQENPSTATVSASHHSVGSSSAAIVRVDPDTISNNVAPCLPAPALNTTTERNLFAENQLLRECVNETTRMHDSLGVDVERLQELRDELEKAVEALRGEVWTLNGQLKASVLDRENLSDRLVDLDSQLIAAKKRADQLDQELSEQVELTEKAQRQAAESENESNRRLAECLEMENRREEVEKAYAQLMEYYKQLHSSYEALYKSVNAQKAEGQTETEISGDDIGRGEEALRLYNLYREQLCLTREQVLTLRSELRALAQDVLASELNNLEASLCSSLHRIQTALSRVNEATNQVPADEHILESIIDSVIEECSLDVDDKDLVCKVEHVNRILIAKHKELEDSHKAISEQRRVCHALEQRLSDLEERTDSVTEADTARQLLESQTLLRQRTHEVEELQKRVDELKESISELTASHSEGEAARLATRQADVDALFRANAELAHTNVQLQNELDELNEGTDVMNVEKEKEKEFTRLRLAEQALKEEVASLGVQMEHAKLKIEEMERELVEARQMIVSAEQAALVLRTEDGIPSADAEVFSELDRLRGVETLLNKTITGYEERLLEAEERIGELEDDLYEQKHAQQTTASSSFTTSTSGATSTTESSWETGESEEGWGEHEREEKPDREATPQPHHSVSTDRLKKNVEDAEKRAGEADQELNILRTMSASLNETISALRVELEQSRRRIEDLEGRVEEAERCRDAEIERSLRRIDEVDKKALEATKVTENLEQADADDGWGESWGETAPEAETADIEEERKAKEDAERERDRLQGRVDDLNKQMDRLEEDFLDQIEEKESLEKELRKRVDDLEQKLSDDNAENKGGRKEDGGWGSDGWGGESDAEVELLRDRLQESETAVRVLQDQIESRQRENKEVCEQLAVLTERLQQVQQERDRALEEANNGTVAQQTNGEDGWGESWGDAEEKTDPLESEKQAREEAERQRDDMQRKVDELSKQVTMLTSNLDNYEAQEEEVEELKVEIEVLRERLNRARAEVEELRYAAERKEKEEVQDSEDWGWGEENKKKEDDQEVVELRERSSRLEEQLRMALVKVDELEEQLIRAGEEQDLVLRESTELQESLQEKVKNLLQHVQSSEIGIADQRTRREEAEKEAENRKTETVALHVKLAELQSQLEKNLAEVAKNHSESGEREREHEQEVEKIKDEMEKTRKKCALLMDSEARLLESVDEYGEQADKYKEEAERLQIVVNELESRTLELDSMKAKFVDLELELEMKRAQHENDGCGEDSASDVSALQEEIELMKKTIVEKETRLERVIFEKQHLESQMTELQRRLIAVEQERDSIKRSFDELRAKIAARRRAAGVPAGASRRSSVASTVGPADHEIPEEPIVEVRSESPFVAFQSSFGSTVSQGVATEEAFRRRGASRRGE